MAKLQLVILGVMLMAITLTSAATMYPVGDSSGWDISTDLKSWAQDKKFVVGDVLMFQYSSYHSVSEVNKQGFEGCNTSNVIGGSGASNTNTSFTLSRPGDRYFVCSHKLHCLGGMKLHVHVEGDQPPESSPASAPYAQTGGSLPPNSSKSKNPSAVVPGSASSYDHHVSFGTMLVVWLGFHVITVTM